MEAKNADRYSPSRFWWHFRFSGFPKRYHLDHIFHSKIDLSFPRRRLGGIPVPTLARPTAHRARKCPLNPFRLIREKWYLV